MTTTITIRQARALKPAPGDEHGPLQLWRYDILTANPDTHPDAPVYAVVATVRATSHLKAAVVHGYPDDARIEVDGSTRDSLYAVTLDGKPLGWVDSKPSGPADSGLLLRAEAAALAGLTLDTFDSYRSRGTLPGPDQMVGRTPLWDAATIGRWLADRPGRGAGGGRPRTGGTVDVDTTGAQADLDAVRARLRELDQQTRDGATS
jgi:predicted DNA-binding transcriptional regulator AlpA